MRAMHAATIVLLLAAAGASGCSEDVFLGEQAQNQPPTVRLTNGPLEGDTTLYQVHFYWVGDDPDGTIDHYEYAITTGDPLGFDPADTTGADKWTATTLTDMTFTVSADRDDSTVTIGSNYYSRYSRVHTLFIRAIDSGGLQSEVAHRSFTAFTLAPTVFIRDPYQSNPSEKVQYLTPVIHFGWEGKDPLDTPWNYQDVDSVRYLHTRYSGSVIANLNARPELFEEKWSPWIAYDAPGDSGRSTILGDDETIELGYTFIFAVQAKDEAGAITSIFDAKTNVRCFIVMKPTGPLLTVYEPYLGTAKFIGTTTPVATVYAPAGLPLRYSWSGDASDYGGTVSTYRYGWDILDLANPDDWDVEASPYITSAPEMRFYSGVHSLHVESVDNVGVATIGKVEITVVPLVMDRSLLWIDDFLSNDFVQINYMMPTESEHDAFWIDICSLADGFDQDIDVYDTAEHLFQAPGIQAMWRYKNIIWTYCAARSDFNAWMKLMWRVSEQSIGEISSGTRYNILAYYLKFGGHLWTVGKADRSGGLAAGVWQLVFPLYVKCEYHGTGAGCVDTSGTRFFAYRDYCVSVLDKAYGVFRTDEDMPVRKIDHDAMTHAVVDTRDPVTLSHPDLPEALHLWERVTEPGMFFDPMVRGFHYTEMYDPAYWMRRNDLRSLSCFHPMYRMRARNTRSAVDNAVIAFWTTKYASIEAEPVGSVAAPSVHFGMPLWFFDRTETRQLAEAIFREWGILREQ